MLKYFSNFAKTLFSFKTFLWMVYISILAVIAPHTQWMFAQLEPAANIWVSWLAAIGFEAAIFVVTHLLVDHIERRKAGTFNFEKSRLRSSFQWWPAFRYRWLNVYTMLLALACGVSAGANLIHAVQYAQPLKIVTDWGVPSAVITVAFGGILPLVNLLFAAVIADVDDAEGVTDPAVEKAKEETKAAKVETKQARAAQLEAERARMDAEQRVNESEQRYRALGDVVRFLFSHTEPLHERIRFTRKTFPQLSQNGISQILGCSVSTVNEALKDYVIESEAVQ
jgi:signal transduction histidine kinase